MLDWNNVLRYVRNRLALPTTFIEKNDVQIKEYLIENSLAEYSGYYPDWERTGIVTNNSSYKHPVKSNWYLIFDEEELGIFGIRECYFPLGGDLITGHPIMPPMSFEGLKCWSLEVFKSRFFKPFSMYSYTVRFIHPNIVELATDFKPDSFIVEYERMQPPDLRKIPQSMQQMFKDLCVADIMIWIGGIRSMYGDGKLQTPFGEIPLNGDTLISKGEDKKRELIDKMAEDSRPPVTIDVF